MKPVSTLNQVRSCINVEKCWLKFRIYYQQVLSSSYCFFNATVHVLDTQWTILECQFAHFSSPEQLRALVHWTKYLTGFKCNHCFFFQCMLNVFRTNSLLMSILLGPFTSDFVLRIFLWCVVMHAVGIIKCCLSLLIIRFIHCSVSLDSRSVNWSKLWKIPSDDGWMFRFVSPLFSCLISLWEHRI